MTAEHERQFDDFGCASRCIIELAKLRKKPISKEDFVRHFEKYFPQNQCGLLGVSAIIDVCRELDLCKQAEAFRSYQHVGQIFDNGHSRGIFLLTEKFWLDISKDRFHCSLILGHNNGLWHVWTPAEKSQSLTNPSVDIQFLEDRLAHFLVLF